MEAKQICACNECGRMLTDQDSIKELPVYDFDGTLDYFLLAHTGCVERLPVPQQEGWR